MSKRVRSDKGSHFCYYWISVWQRILCTSQESYKILDDFKRIVPVLYWEIYRSDGRARLEDDINLGVPVKRDVQGHEYYPLPLRCFEEGRGRRDLIHTLVGCLYY